MPEVSYVGQTLQNYRKFFVTLEAKAVIYFNCRDERITKLNCQCNQKSIWIVSVVYVKQCCLEYNGELEIRK